ncbi:TMhelix containing protein [Vibrio phage 2.275.O._10N.286.54.E11]|nr:TMhelix containing protein [Vibrio phage 2.275.O._10N.286.54.E11]
MVITVNFFELYVIGAAIVAGVIFSVAMIGYITSVVNWYKIFTSGEKVPKQVNGMKIFGVQFYIWSDSDWGGTPPISPGRAVFCFLPFFISGAISSVILGATWFIFIPIYTFVIRAEAKRAANTTDTVVVKTSNKTDCAGPL